MRDVVVREITDVSREDSGTECGALLAAFIKQFKTFLDPKGKSHSIYFGELAALWTQVQSAWYNQINNYKHTLSLYAFLGLYAFSCCCCRSEGYFLPRDILAFILCFLRLILQYQH